MTNVPSYREYARANAGGGYLPAPMNDWLEWAQETLRYPLGIDPYTGCCWHEMFDPDDQPDWIAEHLLDTLEEQIADRAEARRFLRERDEFHASGEYESMMEAISIREDEHRMREAHERDIVRGLGGRWWE